MKIYFYDKNKEYTGSDEKREGIHYLDFTEIPPNIDSYPLDRYKVVFNEDTNEWKYTPLFQDEEKTPETKMALFNKIGELRKELNELKVKKDKYAEIELSARMLGINNDITSKRLELCKKIKDLQNQIKELIDDFDRTNKDTN